MHKTHPQAGDHTLMRLLSQDVACFGIQRGDFRLSGSPSGQGGVAGTQTRDRKVPPDLRTDLLVTLAETAFNNMRISINKTFGLMQGMKSLFNASLEYKENSLKTKLHRP
ncbi:hypothetical protein PoB_002430800 [Plakobranchus ocellatus]|uniref:Uncharacterized protein n=1 Tax=Plakobranchus ocellatus TaxID=259542 RepID=A0AAV3ZSH9_9GAST|nr:hypothetical protein PoB_002430800 [Plakobranchus ocellatus]